MSNSQTQYLSFDGVSVQQLIINRLNEIGAFTDQNYEGSNISSLIEVFAYTYQSLLFYLNKTSTNTLFSDTNVYENINRLVKIIDYKPIGNQTSTLSFSVSALATLAQGSYIIPRYTFFRMNNIIYSFNQDITFTKITSALEPLTDLSNQNLLYQGKYTEYPQYTALGNENEILTLAPGANVVVDHFNIDIYVQDINTGLWTEWTVVPSLFFEDKNSTSVEIRLNENGRYEIKFGNNINGQQLNTGDIVAVYYIESLGSNGEIGIGALNNTQATLYNTTQFNSIVSNIFTPGLPIIVSTDLTKLGFSNTNISTQFTSPETVDDIKNNAPNAFRSQFRLVTLDDYATYIKSNFANIIQDVKATNNTGYLTEYISYFYNLGLNNPNTESRVLFNQLMFADACNFNNLYIFVVPRIEQYVNSIRTNFLTPSQKEIIINSADSLKATTAEIVLLDPVYMAISVGINNINVAPNVTDQNTSYISILPTNNANADLTYIQSQIQNILQSYFINSACTLGQVIDLTSLNNQITNINGVQKIFTRRTDSTSFVEGLSLLIWNPVYNSDVQNTTKNLQLDAFKFPFFFNLQNVIDNIVLENNTVNQTQAIEF